MFEPQRSQYLRALGIDVYVPRLILPGAKLSQPCAWESAASVITEAVAAAVEDAATNTAIGETIAVVRQRSLPAEIHIDIDAPPPVRNTSAANGSGVRAAAELTTTPKIALSVVVGGGLLIVDDAPPGTAARSDYLRLLSNILFALQGRNVVPSLDVFLWPMAKYPQLDQGAAAARETLAAHIHNQIQQHAIHTVLLLGEDAQHWCEVLANDALRCVKSVSALACLQIPANKRQLWQDLRPLAAAR